MVSVQTPTLETARLRLSGPELRKGKGTFTGTQATVTDRADSCVSVSLTETWCSSEAPFIVPSCARKRAFALAQFGPRLKRTLQVLG